MHAKALTSGLSSWILRSGPLGVLVAIWLMSAYETGGYGVEQWFPFAILTAFIGLVVTVLRAYREPPPKRLLIVLALFAIYVIWMALSTIWAMGRASAWEESARAGFYLVFFALALTYVWQARDRSPGRGLLVIAALVLVGVAVVRLAAGDIPEGDFLGKRYQFPITYSNGAAGFYYLLIWPLLWLAADPRGRLWIRALALGAIPPLLQLGLLTQSRGGLAALAISAVFYFLFSPARLRSLVFLVVPALVVGFSFVPLATYYTDGPDQVGATLALLWLAGSWVGVSVVGLVLALVDRRIPVPGRLRLAVSVIVLVAVLAGIGFGTLRLQQRVGDIGEWVSDTTSRFFESTPNDPSEGLSGTRFGMVGGSGRGVLWKSGWQGFLDSPVIGNGAGSFIYVNELYRTKPRTNAKQAHSIELDQLGETGLVGFVLFVGMFASAAGIAVAPRFRSWWTFARRRRPLLLNAADDHPGEAGDVAGQAWTMALLSALALWTVHASVDWIWHLPSVTLGALFLLALALSANAPHRAASARAPRALGGAFRIGLGIVALAVLAATVLPYLSLQYEKAALTKVRTDPRSALAYTSTAHALFPVSPEAFALRAYVYRALAQDAADRPDRGRMGTSVLESLALALAADERAIHEDRASSVRHYQAAMAALDLLAARDPQLAIGAQAARWAGTGIDTAGEDPVLTDGSLAMILADVSERETAEEILGLTNQGLLERAGQHLDAALERNPLDLSINNLLDAVRQSGR